MIECQRNENVWGTYGHLMMKIKENFGLDLEDQYLMDKSIKLARPNTILIPLRGLST